MIGESIVESLHEGYALDSVRDGEDALLALVEGVYDLRLRDLGLTSILNVSHCRYPRDSRCWRRCLTTPGA